MLFDLIEAKEHIGGFWVLEAADLEEALAWGRKAAVACRASVEVRPFWRLEDHHLDAVAQRARFENAGEIGFVVLKNYFRLRGRTEVPSGSALHNSRPSASLRTTCIGVRSMN